MSATTPIETSDAAPPGIPGAPAGESLADYARRWWAGVRSGELGSLPIIVGLILIAIIFQSQNDRFLTAGNFVNLIVQMAAFAVIGMGIVFVLLLGEIDLSIGFVSGVGGVLTALLMLPDGSNEFGAIPAILIALSAGVGIGVLHGLIITKVGVPSFVVTLAGLLAWNGVVLLLIGSRGTVIIQNDFVIGFANDFLPAATAWIVLLAGIALYAGILLNSYRVRRKAGLSNEPQVLIALRVAGLALAGIIVVVVANQDRGVPYVLIVLTVLFILWTYVLNRTRFGRHIYAVGGNTEAARRAGINVDRVEDRVLRDLLVDGGARRDHPRLAPALDRHELGRRQRPALLDRGGRHRRHVPVRRPRPREVGRARRARHRLDRQRARPAGPELRHQVRHHRPGPPGRGGGRLALAARSRASGTGMTAGGPARQPLSARGPRAVPCITTGRDRSG